MGNRAGNAAAAGFCAVVAACGGGGGGGGSDGTASAQYGALRLIDHSPAADAVQVPLDAEIVLRFDGFTILECFADPDTWLVRAGTTQPVAGAFELRDGGRTAAFVPQSPLLAETDYEFQASALTCDRDGRILETEARFSFRTWDERAPVVAGADVGEGATGRSRTAPFTLTFSEAVDPASVSAATVTLRDVFGASYACRRTVTGERVVVQPHADLPGDRGFVLAATTGVRDRAGNPLAAGWSVRFRTAGDGTPPAVVSVWPPTGLGGISPAVKPAFTFSESMDPLTVEAASLTFQDEYGAIVPFAVETTDDQRTLRIVPRSPLQTNRRYTLAFLLGQAAATDVSGNGLAATDALVLTTGVDATPPALATAAPQDGESRVSLNAVILLSFAEQLDAERVDATTVALRRDGEDVDAVIEPAFAGTAIRITPVLPLPPGAVHDVILRGGDEGLRDLAGNPSAADRTLRFTTAADATLPTALLLPPDGTAAVPTGARISVVFGSPMDPATVGPLTLVVTDDAGAVQSGTVALAGGDRVATFVPDSPWQPGTYYRARVRGGPLGMRERSGNWLPDDRTSRFRTGFGPDPIPPVVTVSLNETATARREGNVVPPHGFTVDVQAIDPGDHSLDAGSVRLEFSGPGEAPSPERCFAAATVEPTTFHCAIPAEVALAPGAWTLTVRWSDLSGNTGASAPLAFDVVAPSTGMLPFEKTQVVWVRTDLDRDANGRADFDDDLLRLGFAANGDPAGTNARMAAIVRDGIVARVNALLHRGSRGEPLGPSSVAMRVATREPIGLPHMQIALGGLDPEGDRRRGYGDPSTGILGRAFYDHRNSQQGDRNITSSPGLGVFPAEMFLFQAEQHLQLWPSFQTRFAQRFLPLCPDMGGTPAGQHQYDATVLAPAFDYATAPSAHRARWNVLMTAADEWASAIGVVLAHEIGHAVGLVTAGPLPRGLFGDSTLHDSFAGAAEVMAPSVGYEAMVTLDYRFRDVDLAYLRQRVILR